MVKSITGWWWALGLIITATIPILAFFARGEAPMSVALIQGVSDAADVAIGISVAYLALDRFRYHRRATTLAIGITARVPKTRLLARLLDNNSGNDEMNYLLLLYTAGDEDVRRVVGTNLGKLKGLDFYHSMPGRGLRWLLLHQIDRKLIIILAFSVGLWQLVAGYIQIGPSDLLAFTRAWGIWIVFELIALSYAVPAASYILSEMIFNSIRRSCESWDASLAVILNSQVAQVRAPTSAILGPPVVISPLPVSRMRGPTRRRPPE